MTAPTVVLVPGLRGRDDDHWQTRLATSIPGARIVQPLGRTDPSLFARVRLLDEVVADVDGPVLLVAHSAGAVVTVHWAARCNASSVIGALLATPATLATELPEGFPSIRRLRAHGWLPVPRRPLPFPSIVAASNNDPFGNPMRLISLAAAWGSRVHGVGNVGHLNPASGFGNWPGAVELIDELCDGAVGRDLEASGPPRWRTGTQA